MKDLKLNTNSEFYKIKYEKYKNKYINAKTEHLENDGGGYLSIAASYIPNKKTTSSQLLIQFHKDGIKKFPNDTYDTDDTDDKPEGMLTFQQIMKDKNVEIIYKTYNTVNLTSGDPNNIVFIFSTNKHSTNENKYTYTKDYIYYLGQTTNPSENNIYISKIINDIKSINKNLPISTTQHTDSVADSVKKIGKDRIESGTYAKLYKKLKEALINFFTNDINDFIKEADTDYYRKDLIKKIDNIKNNLNKVYIYDKINYLYSIDVDEINNTSTKKSIEDNIMTELRKSIPALVNVK